MPTYSIHTTVLTLCHSDMFQPSKSLLQGVRQIHFKLYVCVTVHHEYNDVNNQQDATPFSFF